MKKLIKESGHPMSELTRRVLVNLKANTKKWPDGARNKDSLFNAENIKATGTNPFDPKHSHPFPNGEEYRQRAQDVQAESYNRRKSKLLKEFITDKDGNPVFPHDDGNPHKPGTEKHCNHILNNLAFSLGKGDENELDHWSGEFHQHYGHLIHPDTHVSDYIDDIIRNKNFSKDLLSGEYLKESTEQPQYKMSSGPLDKKTINHNSRISQQNMEELRPSKIAEKILSKFKGKRKGK